MKVNQFYVKNQFVITNENNIYFQSYNSKVAKVDEFSEVTLFDDWDYSVTTIKYLKLFLQTYAVETYNQIMETGNGIFTKGVNLLHNKGLIKIKRA